MKFWFQNVVIWFREGGKRTLTFLPNKVNVITGDGNTGKSTVLQIIDYCLCASESKISESVINENVSWYGILIRVNDKRYVICRTALSQGKATDGFYFSSSGQVPDSPEVNCGIDTVKSILQVEFGIDDSIRTPFGGQVIKAGSKLSLRYFLLFTTISEEIMTSSHVFFDKQNQARYREALPRVFDLATGIETPENLLAKESAAKLQADIRRLERKVSGAESSRLDFMSELQDIIRRAKEFGLIDPELEAEDAVRALRKIASDVSPILSDEAPAEYSALRADEYRINQTLRNLKRAQREYGDYKKILAEVADSVKPIAFLRRNNDELIKTSIYDEVIVALEADLSAIKADIQNRTPIDANLTDLIAEQHEILAVVRERLALLPSASSGFVNEREQYFFLGKMTAKLDMYTAGPASVDAELRSLLNEKKDALTSISVNDATERRLAFIRLLEEFIQIYLTKAGNALMNYESYRAAFSYKDKTLSLRKPGTDFVENVNSSSNHMFLHLCFHLGLQEVLQVRGAKFVPSYLVVDQPSRPYYGDDKKTRKKELDGSDRAKIRRAFEVLDLFVDRVLRRPDGVCQLIVLEHVPPSTWNGLEHVHLVEEFTNGNALVNRFAQKST